MTKDLQPMSWFRQVFSQEKQVVSAEAALGTGPGRWEVALISPVREVRSGTLNIDLSWRGVNMNMCPQRWCQWLQSESFVSASLCHIQPIRPLCENEIERYIFINKYCRSSSQRYNKSDTRLFIDDESSESNYCSLVNDEISCSESDSNPREFHRWWWNQWLFRNY